jgi:hypothetical protein
MRRIAALPLLAAPLLIASAALLHAQGPAFAAGQPIKGITCDAGEGQRVHIHQHLAIFDHGAPVAVPAYIGIPEIARCIYWLHTHTPDGIIHIEAPVDRSFTLGDFFAVWGQPLERQRVANATVRRGEKVRVWLDGKVFVGEPATIPLEPHTDIVIQVGPPYTKPAPHTDWGRL